MKSTVIKKIAQLVIKNGVNLQKGQVLIIDCPVHCYDLARALVLEGYKAKAKNVIINYIDEKVDRLKYKYQPVKELTNIPDFVVEKYKYIADSDFCCVHIASTDPNAYQGLDQDKIVALQKAMHPIVKEYRAKRMASLNQWCIVSYPSTEWAKVVFKDLPARQAYKKLEEAILSSSRFTGENLIENWNQHNKNLHRVNKIMNDLNLVELHFTSSNGTDLKIGLANDNIWCGGADQTPQGVQFNPNMPTEECFTMPHKDRVNGRVVATMPLNYRGTLIEDFELTFKDGKVVGLKAGKNEEVLKNMVEMDEGASRLGEVALVPYDSPISNSKILFYNTLFDENASCHLALGNAYPINIKNGANLSEEELTAKGANSSMIHVDFMFGAFDTKIVGVDNKGKQHVIFDKGNYVI